MQGKKSTELSNWKQIRVVEKFGSLISGAYNLSVACNPLSGHQLMDGWMTCDFTLFSTVFQSHNCVQ